MTELIPDMNECGDNNGGCDQHCQDDDGSYFCYCSPGYVLDKDMYRCLGNANSNHLQCIHYPGPEVLLQMTCYLS